MVVQKEPIREESRELDRRSKIARALAAGDPELAELYRTIPYDDETTPEEDAEDARLALEAEAGTTDWEEPGTFLKEWREEEPEFVAMLERVDERFPGWPQIKYRLPEDHPEDLALLLQLDEHEPEAAQFVRRIHDELRQP